jgi:hypothetical protein
VQRALAVHQVLVLLERLAADAEPALVRSFVDIAGRVDAVVRMKSSNDRSRLAQVARNTSSIRSQYASGSRPSSWARRNTFCECSSFPIRKWVSSPFNRWYRATMSAQIFS